jgi:hypothetical protein
MSFLIAYLKAFLDDNDGAKLNQRKRSSTPSPPKNLVMILYLALWYLSLAHTKTQQYIALSMVSMYITYTHVAHNIFGSSFIADPKKTLILFGLFVEYT